MNFRKISSAPISVLAFAGLCLGSAAGLGGETDVEVIETPPPAVQGSTETKKLPDEWKLKPPSKTSPTPKFKEVPSPESTMDKRKYSGQTDEQVKEGWREHSREHFTPK